MTHVCRVFEFGKAARGDEDQAGGAAARGDGDGSGDVPGCGHSTRVLCCIKKNVATPWWCRFTKNLHTYRIGSAREAYHVRRAIGKLAPI